MYTVMNIFGLLNCTGFSIIYFQIPVGNFCFIMLIFLFFWEMEGKEGWFYLKQKHKWKWTYLLFTLTLLSHPSGPLRVFYLPLNF